MVENIAAIAGVVLASLSLLGSAGAVSVLFWRVRQLEVRADERRKWLLKQEELIGEIRQSLATMQEELIGEIHQSLATMQNDLHWLREVFTKTHE